MGREAAEETLAEDVSAALTPRNQRDLPGSHSACSPPPLQGTNPPFLSPEEAGRAHPALHSLLLPSPGRQLGRGQGGTVTSGRAVSLGTLGCWGLMG